MVALLRQGRRSPHVYAELLEDTASATVLLERELSDGQGALFPAASPALLLEQAADDVAHWQSEGMAVVTVLDPDYPTNLRAVHDRPALIFIDGRLPTDEDHSVAIIGSRRASEAGRARARRLAHELGRRCYTIISGLAAGIDTAAHTAALDAGHRTVAVIGTGLRRSYPPENAQLQRDIAGRGAVVSQFWPDSPPSRGSFPERNATMSGLAAATVIVEASPRSGARIQARRALAHGRPVFIARELMSQDWARELAASPGVSAYGSAEEIVARIESLRADTPLTT